MLCLVYQAIWTCSRSESLDRYRNLELFTPALSVTCIATSLDMPSLDLLRRLAYDKNVSRDKWLLYGRTRLLVLKDGFI